MPSYKAPLDDIRFVLNEMLTAQDLHKLPGYEDATPDLMDQVLEEAAKLCENVLFPLNQSGDGEGCHFENGTVRTPKGFKEAYQQFAEGGWCGLSCDPDFGGQGLPKVLNNVIEEMICSSNIAFGMYPGLSHGAYNAIEKYGTPEQKALYLPKLVDGTWSGTMCLTEPHCGTDLGLIRTKAVPNDDGSFAITGTKIFISAGEQDLTENIVHLCLAKLPNAPDGVKGISLFVVPKFLPKDDGTPGERNHVFCGSIEHKMGIKASATCVMNFDGAKGWLVGQPHKGMQAMFVFMNTARLGVAIQGLGLSEVSYQNALAYAKDRLQGRSLTGAKAPEKAADPLIVHPDVRKNLLTMKAYTEAARVLAYQLGLMIDLYTKHEDPAVREEAEDYVALMTPIAKSFMTDGATDICNIGLQIYGGHGYIKEWGMEQYVRDARITQIYEGANGIQALDLVGRKLSQGMGRLLRRFFHPVQTFLAENAENEAMAEFVMPVAKSFGKLQQATVHLAQAGMKNPDEAGAASMDYLNMFAHVVYGYIWAWTAQVAQQKLAEGAGDRAAFYEAKLHTARFYMQRLLPKADTHFKCLMAGGKSMMDVPVEAF